MSFSYNNPMFGFDLISKNEILDTFGEAFLKSFNGVSDLFEVSDDFYPREVIRNFEFATLYHSEQYGEFFFECSYCHSIEYYKENHTVINGSDTLELCTECFESERDSNDIVQCDFCGLWYTHIRNNVEAIYNEYGNHVDGYVCRDCLECGDCFESIARCEDCGRLHDIDHLTNINEFEPHNVCNSCLDSDYFYCEDCNNYFPRGVVNRYYIDDADATICENCYQNGDYFECERCGTYYTMREYAEDDLCNSCYEEVNDESEHSLLHCYGYKPEPKMHHCNERSKLTFGTENEFSFPSYSERNSCLDEFDDVNFDNLHYCKEDSSLSYGIEFVSHPFTLNYMRQNRKHFERLFKVIRQNEAEADDGLHVHIAKGAMSEAHQCRFGAFVYTFLDKLRVVARRSCNDYCKPKSKPDTGEDVFDLQQEGDRYFAVNYTNRHTVELRIFKDTLSVNHYFAAVELCHSIYQFTKNKVNITAILRTPGATWLDFLEFVGSDKRYFELANMLRENAFEAHYLNNAMAAIENSEKRIERRKNARKAA